MAAANSLAVAPLGANGPGFCPPQAAPALAPRSATLSDSSGGAQAAAFGLQIALVVPMS